MCPPPRSPPSHVRLAAMQLLRVAAPLATTVFPYPSLSSKVLYTASASVPPPVLPPCVSARRSPQPRATVQMAPPMVGPAKKRQYDCLQLLRGQVVASPLPQQGLLWRELQPIVVAQCRSWELALQSIVCGVLVPILSQGRLEPRTPTERCG